MSVRGRLESACFGRTKTLQRGVPIEFRGSVHGMEGFDAYILPYITLFEEFGLLLM